MPGSFFLLLVKQSSSKECVEELKTLSVLRDWIPHELTIEAKDVHQRSVKVSVVHVADTQVLELLKDRGADIDVRDSWGRVPLHVAAWYGHNKLLL